MVEVGSELAKSGGQKKEEMQYRAKTLVRKEDKVGRDQNLPIATSDKFEIIWKKVGFCLEYLSSFLENDD